MPFFSPDGQWLGFLEEGQLKKVAVSGGAPVTIATVGAARGASWGSDGTIVFAQESTFGLSRVSAEGGALEILTLPSRERREKAHRLPEILPGGSAVVFTLASADIVSWEDADIAALSLETGEYHVVVEGGTNARYSASALGKTDPGVLAMNDPWTEHDREHVITGGTKGAVSCCGV